MSSYTPDNSGSYGSSSPTGYPADSGKSSGAPLPDSPNKRLMRRYVREVIDSENPAAGDRFFTENFYNHDPAPGEEPGLVGVKEFIGSIFAAFSGFRTNVNEQIADDDLVVGRWTQTFTQTGSYLGFPVSGRKVNIGGITITRVRDDRIVEEWEARDATSLLQQLGVVEPLYLEGGDVPGDVEEIARRYVLDVWAGGKPELVDEVFSEDFVNHILLPGQKPGREGIKQFLSAYQRAFPDFHVSLDFVITEKDRAVVRWTTCGTHRDVFLGIPATGRYAEFTGITIFRIESGRIVEQWGYWELATLLANLGVLEFPGGSPPSYGDTARPPDDASGRLDAEGAKALVSRWFGAINSGDTDALDKIVDYDVIDHSGLSSAHGHGCDGHKVLVRELRRVFPDWQSTIRDIQVDGDIVTIRHIGSGTHSSFSGLGRAQPAEFEITSCVRIGDGKVVEHWATQGPFGEKSSPSGGQRQDGGIKAVAARWFDAINSGNDSALDHVVDYDVVDHSGLSLGHGHGCDGHKALVRELRRVFPDWQSTIRDMQVDGDLVTIRHVGSGTHACFSGLGRAQPVEFEITSCVRIRDGKVVEHWATQGPFGQKTSPAAVRSSAYAS